MLLIWGNKRVVSKVGYIADFCPICRMITPFQVNRIGLASHLYYIPFGQGKLIAHTEQCQKCGTVMKIAPENYATIEKRSGLSLDNLIQTTFPNIHTVYAQRLELEEKIKYRTAFFSPEEREALLMEPFGLLGQQAQVRLTGDIPLDWNVGIGCLGTCVLATLLAIGTMTIWKTPSAYDRALIAIGIVVAIGISYTSVQVFLSPRRFIQRSIVPRLVQALKPLGPTKDELAVCIDKLKAKGFKIGKVINAVKLWEAMQPRQNVISTGCERSLP